MSRRKQRIPQSRSKGSPFSLLWIGLIAVVPFILMVFLVDENTQGARTSVEGKYVGWASPPTNKDGMIEVSLRTLNPDPLSWVHIIVNWDGKEATICDVPLAGSDIICVFDPELHKIPSGTTVRFHGRVTSFMGQILENLPDREVVWVSSNENRRELFWWITSGLLVALIVGAIFLSRSTRRSK